MSVLASRSGTPRDADSGLRIGGDGVGELGADDIGSGRGPAWLDDWLARNSPDIVAWYRHIHANPELSGQELNTTEFVACRLASVGLRPTLLPGGTGLMCDVGSGER